MISLGSPTTRVLALLELLQARPGLRGGELAERLGVDARTVRRDAARLAELGIPVQAERGRYGGYRLRPGYKLPPLMLNDDEAVAVVLGLLAGRRTGLVTAGEATESALAKLTRVLPDAVRSRVAAVPDALGLTPVQRSTPAPATATVLTLSEAARDRRRVRLRYRSWKGEETERDLDPYGLVFSSGRWYVTGHDGRSGEIRTFRLDRVLAAEPGTGTFAAPDDFDPVEHVSRSLAGAPFRWEVEVVLGATMDEVRRRVPPSVATLAEVEGGVLLRARAERLDGMAQMLAGLGWPVTVRTPAELRGELRALAARLEGWAAS